MNGLFRRVGYELDGRPSATAAPNLIGSVQAVLDPVATQLLHHATSSVAALELALKKNKVVSMPAEFESQSCLRLLNCRGFLVSTTEFPLSGDN